MQRITEEHRIENKVLIFLLYLLVTEATRTTTEQTQWRIQPLEANEKTVTVDDLNIDIIGNIQQVVRIKTKSKIKENITLTETLITQNLVPTEKQFIEKLESIRTLAEKIKEKHGRIWIKGRPDSLHMGGKMDINSCLRLANNHQSTLPHTLQHEKDIQRYYVREDSDTPDRRKTFVKIPDDQETAMKCSEFKVIKNDDIRTNDYEPECRLKRNPVPYYNNYVGYTKILNDGQTYGKYIRNIVECLEAAKNTKNHQYFIWDKNTNGCKVISKWNNHKYTKYGKLDNKIVGRTDCDCKIQAGKDMKETISECELIIIDLPLLKTCPVTGNFQNPFMTIRIIPIEKDANRVERCEVIVINRESDIRNKRLNSKESLKGNCIIVNKQEPRRQSWHLEAIETLLSQLKSNKLKEVGNGSLEKEEEKETIRVKRTVLGKIIPKTKHSNNRKMRKESPIVKEENKHIQHTNKKKKVTFKQGNKRKTYKTIENKSNNEGQSDEGTIQQQDQVKKNESDTDITVIKSIYDIEKIIKDAKKFNIQVNNQINDMKRFTTEKGMKTMKDVEIVIQKHEKLGYIQEGEEWVESAIIGHVGTKTVTIPMAKTGEGYMYHFINIPTKETGSGYQGLNIPSLLVPHSMKEFHNLGRCTRQLIQESSTYGMKRGKAEELECQKITIKRHTLSKKYINNYTIMTIVGRGELAIMCDSHGFIKAKGIMVILIDNYCRCSFNGETIKLGEPGQTSIRVLVIMNKKLKPLTILDTQNTKYKVLTVSIISVTIIMIVMMLIMVTRRKRKQIRTPKPNETTYRQGYHMSQEAINL